MSTPSQMDFNGKILFLEDLTENLYHIDRMIRQLKRSGALSDLKGLVVGQFTEMVDNSTPFGKSAEEIIFEAVSEWTYPLAFDAPIGHVVENISAIHGANAELKVLEDKILIRYM
jgi:muramoyltetrapeptide carboxypeptidase